MIRARVLNSMDSGLFGLPFLARLYLCLIVSLIKNFFQETRILDGGMGQELLNRGVKPYGTLWGASALYNRKWFSKRI